MSQWDLGTDLREKELSDAGENTKENIDTGEDLDDIPEDEDFSEAEEDSDDAGSFEEIPEDDELSVMREKIRETLENTDEDFGEFAKELLDTVNEINSYLVKGRNISDKIDYTDTMRSKMEIVLSGNPERKEEWDIIRGRLAEEYEKETSMLKEAAEKLQETAEKMKAEYADILSENPDTESKLYWIAKYYSDMEPRLEELQSKIIHSEHLSEELAKDLDPEKRTVYTGVGGRNFTDCHYDLIQEQGNAVKNFRGTCGICSSANTMTLLGDTKTEAEVIARARELNACTDRKVRMLQSEDVKNSIRDSNGGTSYIDRERILESYGYECENTRDQSLKDIQAKLSEGCGAIICVDHDVLYKSKDVSALCPQRTDHALTITGIESDSNGNPVGLWIHDTGVISSMGSAFYCSIEDYETWRSTPTCVVQYVSK